MTDERPSEARLAALLRWADRHRPYIMVDHDEAGFPFYVVASDEHAMDELGHGESLTAALNAAELEHVGRLARARGEG